MKKLWCRMIMMVCAITCSHGYLNAQEVSRPPAQPEALPLPANGDQSPPRCDVSKRTFEVVRADERCSRVRADTQESRSKNVALTSVAFDASRPRGMETSRE